MSLPVPVAGASKPNVVVVVPLVSSHLSPYEQIALRQLFAVLGQHPIVALAPERLRGQLPVPSASFADTVFMPDATLASVASYNLLMLSSAFYRAFAGVEHMLIHQLDAFVFRDELAAWAAQPYDYIGPPWAYGWAFAPWHRQLDRRLKARWAWLRQTRQDPRARARYHALRVGNGGFSLRRIPALLELLKRPTPMLKTYWEKGLPEYPEDLFWGVDAHRAGAKLRLPDWHTALRFGVESAPRESLAALGRPPFGCHAWYKLDLDAWRPHIAAFGHVL